MFVPLRPPWIDVWVSNVEVPPVAVAPFVVPPRLTLVEIEDLPPLATSVLLAFALVVPPMGSRPISTMASFPGTVEDLPPVFDSVVAELPGSEPHATKQIEIDRRATALAPEIETKGFFDTIRPHSKVTRQVYGPITRLLEP